MMKNFFLLLLFALLGWGCSSISSTYPLNVKLTEGMDPSVESVDTECAYFYFMWGRTAELDNKLEEAREAYEKALVCDLHAVQVMRRLAVLLVNMDKKRDAANWMQRIIDEDPGDESSRNFLANLYISLEVYDKAEDVFKKVLKGNPDDVDTMLLLASLYARQNKLSEARDILEKLVKKDSLSFIGYHYLARIYQDLQLFDKAREAFNKALELNWSPMLAAEVGAFLEKQGDYEASLEVYQKIINEDESDDTSRTHIVALFLELGRTEEAVRELEELKNYSNDLGRINLNLGRLLMDLKRYDQAIVPLQEALLADPSFQEARILLGIIYHEKGDNEDAINVLKQVDPQANSYEEAVLYMVQIFSTDKRFIEAENLLREQISDQKGKSARYYIALAEVFQDQRKFVEAEVVFNEALTEYPADDRIYFEYALFLEESGDTSRALTNMEKVLELKPDNPFAMNYIGYTWADQGINLDKAHEYIKAAVAQKPNDGYVRDSLGWVLFKLGKLQDARKELEAAAVAVPTDSTIHDHLGDVYHALGIDKEAIVNWEKALELQKDDNKRVLLRRKIEAVRK
ncbi:MAG: tetratricopeptide repeat protein [Proteobacteria bacterium]|nr:tetratricopeptide repeat protein [Pseudomonadota bacterium]MBU1687280.1 tetratricopeptide repeat protein [Pseudomonadota bacterium]